MQKLPVLTWCVLKAMGDGIVLCQRKNKKHKTKNYGETKGVITLEDRAGKLTFIHGKDGFTARSAEGINGKKICCTTHCAK